MKNDTYYNRFADILIEKLSSHSTLAISFYVTIFVLAGSIPAVYLFAIIFTTPYTSFLFIISVALPIVLTPITILLFIRLTKHLKYYQEDLSKEIEKNKAKDIILFEQARFVLMGEMMANISHQWKQPLNTINLSVFNARISNKDELEKYFDIMEDNVNYLASTIDDFMSFFDQKSHLEIKKLSTVVKEIKSIIEVQMKNKGINFNIVIDDSCCNIRIASSISQVLLNLLSNSKDAFDCCRFTKTIENREVTLKLTATQKGLEVFCCDNGKGIDLDIRDKIFDPYFTTKVQTQGTGIGLYMSKQIVQKVFDGNIDIKSLCSLSKECENETCFQMLIPYSDRCIKKEK